MNGDCWYFAYISHANEDKAASCAPVGGNASGQEVQGLVRRVHDDSGSNLRRSIEQGLARVIRSCHPQPQFLRQEWTNLELDGLFALEKPGEKRILPVWHNVSGNRRGTVLVVHGHATWCSRRAEGLDQVVVNDRRGRARVKATSPAKSTTPPPAIVVRRHCIRIPLSF